MPQTKNPCSTVIDARFLRTYYGVYSQSEILDVSSIKIMMFGALCTMNLHYFDRIFMYVWIYFCSAERAFLELSQLYSFFFFFLHFCVLLLIWFTFPPIDCQKKRCPGCHHTIIGGRGSYLMKRVWFISQGIFLSSDRFSGTTSISSLLIRKLPSWFKQHTKSHN